MHIVLHRQPYISKAGIVKQSIESVRYEFITGLIYMIMPGAPLTRQVLLERIFGANVRNEIL